jgi:hypothetical protein
MTHKQVGDWPKLLVSGILLVDGGFLRNGSVRFFVVFLGKIGTRLLYFTLFDHRYRKNGKFKL